MLKIIHFFQTNKVKIVKLNHNLRTEGPTEFDALLHLEKDGDTFTITNKIP